MPAVIMIALARSGRVKVARGDETAEELVIEQLAPEGEVVAAADRDAR
jgi:hypothetical protein